MDPHISQENLLAELTSGNEARAEEAALQLAAAGEAIVPALEPLLHSEEPDHRWWAVRTLGQMGSPPIDWLVQALGDKTGDVRAAAALALVTHPAQDAVPALVEALQDEDSIVAILAVNALVAVGSGAVPALIEIFPRLHPRGRIQAMRAVAELRDHRAIPLMLKGTEDESAMVRYWAEEAIERLGLNMVYIKPE